MSDLQTNTFAVRIQPPATESFKLEVRECNSIFWAPSCISMPSAPWQVSGQMLVAELHQLLTEHEVTCHRTCFSLRLGGVPLDGQAKLRSVQGVQDGAAIKVEEGNCLNHSLLLV